MNSLTSSGGLSGCPFLSFEAPSQRLLDHHEAICRIPLSRAWLHRMPVPAQKKQAVQHRLL
jgi:hypothetical protein